MVQERSLATLGMTTLLELTNAAFTQRTTRLLRSRGPGQRAGGLLHPFAQFRRRHVGRADGAAAGRGLSRAAARHARPWRQRADRRRLYDERPRRRR